jgi:DNA-binding response OmpR family regulator
VDDEEFVRLLVAQILGRAGYELDFAADGDAALARLDARRPDLVILDLMMPGMNGWSVLERMRKRRDAPPVIMLTAHGSYDAFTRGVREGVVGYISKPFSLEELLVACSRALTGEPEREEDRREGARRPLMVRVRILGPDASSLAAGELVNLSAQGGQVDLAVSLAKGQNVRLTFDVPGGGTPLVLDAAVEWQRPGEGRYLHGLVFRNLTREAESELAELLRPPD